MFTLKDLEVLPNKKTWDTRRLFCNGYTERKSGYNEAIEEISKLDITEVLKKAGYVKLEDISNVIRLRYFKLMFPNITEASAEIVADVLTRAIRGVY